jgi:anaerobic magnesium-protoporphyrin IX monomethyl ester cyclase
MNITFIESPSPWLVRKQAQVPLGPLYLATILIENGYSVTMQRPFSVDEIDTNFDVFCLSGTTLEYTMNTKISQYIRENNCHAVIILGGTHATALPDSCYGSGNFDIVFSGEGESNIVELIEAAVAGYRGVFNSTELVTNLDTVPFPDRKLIVGSHGGDIFANYKNYIGTGSENFITARGCPFNCYFCASDQLWPGKVRFRSIRNIVLEMKDIIAKYNIRQFRICDDNVTSHPTRCLELCDEIQREGLDIVWRCSVRAESLTDDMSAAMSKAGCKEVSVGIESGDQRVLDSLNKRTTLDKMYNGCLAANKYGMDIRALMLIGTPCEHLDTPEKNRDYLASLPYDIAILSTFVPLPGTAIWDEPSKFNCEILTKDFSLYNKDYWVYVNGNAQKRKYKPLIRNLDITLEQQINNVRRMEYYIEQGAYNRG